jgi:hypothetical protein
VNHRRAIVGLFVVSMLVAGTAAYDIARSDRPAEVVVAGDDEAYLGIERVTTDEPITNGNQGTVLRVTNRFDTRVDLTVTVEGAGASLVSPPAGDETTLEESESRAVEVECESANTTTLELELRVEGNDVAVDAAETVTVECEPRPTAAGTTA